MAANALLDRGWGKPTQALVGQDDGEIRVIIRQVTDVAPDSEVRSHGNVESTRSIN
jgi:hypothetical protein